MPRDSQGNCSQNFDWRQDDANSIGIESGRHQDNDDDHLQMLTDSLDRQGRGGMQADLKMGNNKITQVNEGTDATDGLNISQAQAEAYKISSTETGTANAYVIALTPAPTAYTLGLTVKFVATNANTGASTLQVGSLVPAPALQWQAKDLVANDITAGGLVEAVYDGNAFQITNVPEILQLDHGGTGAQDAATARTNLGLGTAAVEDVGTAIGNVVQLEDVGGNAGLPAVDGSQLTGISSISTATLKRQIFTASGTFNKSSIGASATNVLVKIKAGGGAGGGAAATGASDFSTGGGGGEGESAEILIDVSALGTTETVTVGAGGVAVSGAAGNDGGNSSFGAFATTNGGKGGGTATGTDTAPLAGEGGDNGTGGDIHYKGQAGTTAHPTGNAVGGTGGGQGGTRGEQTGATPSNAKNGGGGGGSANGSSQAARPGSNGGDGYVIVEWTELA